MTRCSGGLIGSLEPASVGLASIRSEPPTYSVVFGSGTVPDRKVTNFNASGLVIASDSQSNPGTQ